ncbi:MAG: molybdenum cofactor biosynthesis protein MoaE [Pirellulales bacterium]|nr:molybdenum cofactor biosynthesis protein MoaE [Pirellulales bacterium]
MSRLTHDPIDVAAMLAAAAQPAAGGVVLFLGITRQFTGAAETVELAYEAYEAMAERRLESLAAAARKRWSLAHAEIVHRLGVVPVGEPSVAIVASSPHRADAFAAGQWLIDELKADAPIWKQERYADGRREWVHPQPASTTGEPANQANERE